MRNLLKPWTSLSLATTGTIATIVALLFLCPMTAWIGWLPANIVSTLTGYNVVHVAMCECLIVCILLWLMLPIWSRRMRHA